MTSATKRAPTDASKTRLLLVDDHTLLRQSLRAYLENPPSQAGHTDPGFEVFEAENGRDALRVAETQRPEVVLMDAAMHDLNGLDATRMLLKEWPEMRVVGLSMHREASYVKGMLDAGARGFLLKTCRLEDLVRAVRAVLAGGLYLDPEVADVMVRAPGDPAPEGGVCPPPSELTPKEREVLQLVAEGCSSKEVAARMGISDKTVESHRAHLTKKLGVGGVAGLTKYAVRNGLTPLER